MDMDEIQRRCREIRERSELRKLQVSRTAPQKKKAEWLSDREYRARREANEDARKRAAERYWFDRLGTELIRERDRPGAYRLKKKRRK